MKRFSLGDRLDSGGAALAAQLRIPTGEVIVQFRRDIKVTRAVHPFRLLI
jgi:hypothetical protein